MEEYLDLISIGKANYITIIRNFYEMFNPTVQKLLLKVNVNTDK
jgi:DNA topoisomerase IA